VRIALIPLDSRPPSWQFPLRIAQIANTELVSPPRELLGTLHKGGDQRALLQWLKESARDTDAAVVSWDALVYGGLVQSRTEGHAVPLREIIDGLSAVDWSKCAGYLWLTVPRLGMTIASYQDWDTHRLIAEYFRLWGVVSQSPNDEKAAARLHELEAQIGSELLSRAWALRRRNIDYARDALMLAAQLGFRTCHVAVEDNARTGPHLGEVEELRKLALELTVECRREGREPPRFTFFDGTDECGSLLTARAILDERKAPPLPVRLTLFPSSPSPDQYFGLYESHSLEDGLLFLAKFLGFEYRAEGKAQWLVCFGRQPQPDVFAEDPERVFNNPLLLPEKIGGDEPLFVADLQACNGGNPHLLQRLYSLAGSRLLSLSAWNTNFNALGFSAAVMAVERTGSSMDGTIQLLCERIGDDYLYQSCVRARLLNDCRERGLNPLDISDPAATAALERKAGKLAGEVAEKFGFPFDEEEPFVYSFPWNRLFEAYVELA
jgi:hypothetical protein